MQIIENQEEYDVCIVGSGAGGGMAAHELTKAGANVLILEAGGWFDSEDFAMFTWPYESPRRGASTRLQPFGEFDACFGGWDIEGEPYTTTEGTEFNWFRGRMLGGRTNHWGRISLRFGPDDFNVRSLDGMGHDWPIDYQDLKPYYNRLDRQIGIFGTNEGIPNAPGGIYMDPPEPRCYEHLIKDACDDMGIPCIPSRMSILTEPHNGRAACHYCGQCNRGCATHSNFSTPSVLLPPALETGNLEIINNAMVREVTYSDGKATGVSYVNKENGKEYKVKSKVVVLAASACESARLLLNSKSSDFPNGLANSSGTVGKYLMDSTGTSVMGLIPDLMDMPAHNEDGTGGLHLYIPWWKDNNSSLDFARGYHVELWGGRGMPSYGFMGGIQNYNDLFHDGPKRAGGYGKQLKDDYRRYYGSMIGFSGRGESIAYEDNYCEIDPDTVDEWGIPVLRFNYEWSDQEYKQVKHMQETFRSIIDEMGGKAMWDMPSKEEGYGITKPGEIIHEVGTTRMGKDPDSSVLNEYCQAHDVDNLFVADGGPFVSQPHKNPTWTILALSMRTSDYIADQMEKGNL